MKWVELWHNHADSWQVAVDSSSHQLAPDQVLVRSLYSLVSTGTERLVMTSELDEPTRKRMSLPLMKGTFDQDFTYGYSLTGVIEQGPADLVGQHVHLLHPHQSYAIVATSDITVIPEALAERAVLVSNLETVINAVWDSQVSLGDEVLVIGYGIIGALLVQLLRQMPGVTVRVYDIDPTKQQLANPYETGNPAKEFDIVFHTSGSSSGLQYGIDQLKPEGTLMELSWYGGRKVEVALGQSFHYDRKKIISTQVSTIPHCRAQRWDYARRKQLAISLLSLIDFEHLIMNSISFSEAVHFFGKLRRGEVKDIGTLIKY